MQASDAQDEAIFINISIATARAVELVKLRRAAEEKLNEFNRRLKAKAYDQFFVFSL